MDPVHDQYEALPYPARDPADEARRLILGSPSHLAEIDHYLFAGCRDWRRPVRMLVAGGGTGDALVMLAQQLAWAGAPADLVYLDISRASRRIAEARIAARGLTGIRFETGSLLDAPRFGPFDYIDCCGVLHHLPDPAEGLGALGESLAPGGGIGLMLYGALGRQGVYELQALLRRLAPPERPVAERLAITRRLLAALPPTNSFRRNTALGDHRRGDAELFDLLLHARDQAFDVTQLKSLIEGAGLTLSAFIAPARYDPATYAPALESEWQRLAPTPWIQAEMAEALAGNIKTHVLYVRRAGETAAVATLTPEAVPVLREPIGGALAAAVARTGRLTGTLDGLSLSAPLPPEAPAILRALDGRRSCAALATATGHPLAAVTATLKPLIAYNLVCLSGAFVRTP